MNIFEALDAGHCKKIGRFSVRLTNGKIVERVILVDDDGEPGCGSGFYFVASNPSRKIFLDFDDFTMAEFFEMGMEVLFDEQSIKAEQDDADITTNCNNER